jgi:ABC-type branched-subunit amino acid transport system substrate-binding protein
LLAGFKSGLDTAGPQIVNETTYLPTDLTIDSQMVQMKTAGADFLYLLTVPKTAVQALTKLGAMNWRPQIFFSSGNSSVLFETRSSQLAMLALRTIERQKPSTDRDQTGAHPV